MLDEVTAGTHDAIFTAMGAKIAQLCPDTVYARLDWEMNDKSANYNAAKFQAAWAHAVPIIRAGFAGAARSGQTLKIVYCYDAQGGNLMTYYPTDETTVDIIAGDVYASVYGTTIPTQAALVTAVRGYLDTLSLNGATHGKPVALGEFGQQISGTGGVTGEHGSASTGDVPAVVAIWMDWAEQNQAVYLSYFDISGGVNVDLGSTPNTLAALIARYTAL